MDPKEHWENIYRTKSHDQVSWFEAEATLSLALILHIAPDREANIIDVGAGSSTLVDGLVQSGYRHITVLDLAAAALAQSQHRLDEAAQSVIWREADILAAELPGSEFDVWHDRAVFHFLTEATDRLQYVAQVRHALRPGGHAIVATFAEDGPTKCSGLEVARYAPHALHAQFGEDFHFVASENKAHHTPWGTPQAFTYCLCRYEPRTSARDAA